MVYVTIEGWRPGLNKVALTRLFQSDAGLSLREAKARTDHILAGRAVRIPVADAQAADRLIEAANGLGAVVAAVPTSNVRNAR